MKRLLVTISFLFTSIVFANPIHHLVFFGDSLSDNGNLYSFMDKTVPSPNYYYEGRFSNGIVWSEFLANHYFPKDTSNHVENYAMGMASVSSDRTQESPLFILDGQLETYFKNHPEGSSLEDSLFVFWIGSNNYLGIPDDDADHTVTADVIAGINKNMELLVQKGAKNIVVLNLPDIGNTPFARSEDLYHDCPPTHKTCASDALTDFSNRHNQSLYQSIFNSERGLKAKYPEVHWMFFNVNRMFSDVMQHPGYYGLTTVDEPCLKFDLNAQANHGIKAMFKANSFVNAPSTCEGYLFYDPLHPTTIAHKIIAEKVMNMFYDLGLDIS